MPIFFKSLYYAASGIFIFVVKERHAKFHTIATVGVLVTGFVVNLSAKEWQWILLTIALVWISEMANTAIEKLCDKVSPEISPEIKFVKDVSAGFVLIASIFALINGIIIFKPYLLNI